MNRRKNLVALDGNDNAEAVEDVAEVATTDAAADEVPEEFPETGEYSPAWQDEEVWEEQAVPARNWAWVVPTLAILTIAAWSGFFGWLHRAQIAAGPTPAQWGDWIVDWAVPVLLVVSLWILARRNSRREAKRFGETAQMLAAESAALEQRLAVVNRELSLAREFIASQSRDLESLGRVASERLSEHADRLQSLIRDNGEQVNAIGEVSTTALGNMDRLRDQLPVIANAARDVTSQIGNAGHTAKDQLDELVAGFARLNEFGEASGRQVDSLRDKVSETLTAFEEQTSALERLSQERFETLRQQSDDFRVELEARETDTLAAIRRRADELGAALGEQGEHLRQREEEALSLMHSRLAELREEGARMAGSIREGQDEVEARSNSAVEQLRSRMSEAIGEISRIDEASITSARQRLEALSVAANETDSHIIESADRFETEFSRRRELAASREAEAIEAMHVRLAEFDQQASQRQEEHLAHVAGLAERGEALAQRLAELDVEIGRLSEQGRQESARLGETTEGLSEKVSQSRAILEESGAFVSRLTDDSVRLLEIIRSAADHSEGALSSSISTAEGRLASFQEQASALKSIIEEAETRGGALIAHVENCGSQSKQSLEVLEALEARLAAFARASDSIAEKARQELQEAIATLEEASTQTLENLRGEQAATLREIAERIGSEGSEAIEKALRDGADQAIAELAQSAREAGEQGRETAAQLRDQLAMVNELAGNLEQRVAVARERAEEKIDHDFSRRMALITESLNSYAIDISKAFDTEVTDTAWASYLRGDRGIFTRRAVRLLDHHESRAMANLYEEDPEYRDAVNRYIHDFEAMLRNVLSTRDGNAMAVTLLSSEIGKLYVVLAQAIERLRE